jgi:hypothetical protein
VGFLMVIPLMILLVVLPFELLTRLPGFGVTTPLSAMTVAAAGIVVAGFVAARYVVKPTRAYGPMSIAASAFSVGYLFLVAQNASAMIQSHGTSVTLSYGTVFLLLAVVPLLGMGAGVATTIEDIRHPGERLPFDFPP